MDWNHTSGRDEIHDVVVVGARCAGSATAMLLARQGVDVLVLDRSEFPSDTLSTHAISRGGVVQLSRWGLLDDVVASGAPPIRTVTFFLPVGEVTRTVKDAAGVDFLLAPRRYVLDAMLVEAARTAGATIETGVTVLGPSTDVTGRVTGVTVRDRQGALRRIAARMVVGADGVRSGLARSVRAPVLQSRPSGGTTSYAYVAGLDSTGFEFHIGPRTFCGVFPTHDGEAAVWIGLPDDRAVLNGADRSARFLDLLSDIAPHLGARVRAARVTSPVRSASGLPNHVRQAAGPGWALVGDAGYHRDPITGHGITDAFRDAELLARRLADVVAGDRPEGEAMSAYASERDRALIPTFDITCRLSQFPPPDEFIELQKQLSVALEAEAAFLAALPPLRLAGRTAA